MTNSYTIEIDGIGPVLLEKSRRARRVIISVRPSKATRVAVPMRISFEKALEFVHLKKGWIRKQLTKIEQDKYRLQALSDRFMAIDKTAAKRKLTERLNHLAKEHGFSCNNVTIREQRTRWGSCSAKNNISLNLKLVLLPEDLIDYVMLHELVHTRIHNHSKKFWAELDKYTGNAKAMARRLRMNGLRLL